MKDRSISFNLDTQHNSLHNKCSIKSTSMLNHILQIDHSSILFAEAATHLFNRYFYKMDVIYAVGSSTYSMPSIYLQATLFNGSV